MDKPEALGVDRIIALANEAFGDPARANRWLNRPLRPFGGKTAMQMAETGQRAQQVEILLDRIAHGIAA